MKRALDAFKFKAEDLPACAGARSIASSHAKKKIKCVSFGAKSDGCEASAEDEESGKRRRALVPFVAPSPAKYRERFASVCKECFEKSERCTHFEEAQLKLVLIGHNPSEHAWASGYFYSNPTNKMWKLLTGQSLGKDAPMFHGILPNDLDISAQNRLPSEYGVGLTDLGLEPGNNAQSYGKGQMIKWSAGLYARLHAHQERAGGPPKMVAFTGKRQFTMLFPSSSMSVEHGQFTKDMPSGWPYPSTTQVWVLPSSSGRAVMTHAQRIQPYLDLARAFHELSEEPLAQGE